ncbi:hypothetical protein [Glutamicibacter ardleyensis]|uniref:hypothetical protein n=1 Tax=Glutamicibacter ardleyensis TaxID=225894 RepID=UPI003FCFBEAE
MKGEFGYEKATNENSGQKHSARSDAPSPPAVGLWKMMRALPWRGPARKILEHLAGEPASK